MAATHPNLLRNWLFIFWVLATLTTPVRADHVVNNGGGSAEASIAFALMTFARQADLCQSLSPNCISPAENEAMATIREALPSLVLQQDLLVFKTEAEAPGLFDRGGERLKFVTEKTPGAQIAINRDMIYRPTGTGLAVPIALHEAYIWISEMLFHQLTDVPALRARDIGVSIAAQTRNQGVGQTYGLSDDAVYIYDPSSRLEIRVVNGPGPSTNFLYSELILRDSESILRVSDSVTAGLDCGDGELLGFNLSRLRIQGGALAIAALTVRFTAELRYHCSNDPARIIGFSGEGSATFDELVVSNPRNANDRAFRYRSDSTNIQRLP